MPLFNEILPTLSPIDSIASLSLTVNGQNINLENKPGTSGSVAVYNEVSKETGYVDVSAAEKALELYAEHTQDARENPCKHPNIDRLFEVIETGNSISIKVN